jgi:hypothetical protein
MQSRYARLIVLLAAFLLAAHPAAQTSSRAHLLVLLKGKGAKTMAKGTVPDGMAWVEMR